MYQLADKPSSSWKRKTTDSAEETLIITGLSPETKYVFKVRPELEKTLGTESEVSDPIKTKAIVSCQPGKPSARESDITHNSIQLNWRKPVSGSVHIQCYTILYRLANDLKSNWSRKTTDSAVAMLFITGLSLATEYIFKVRAELADGNVGPESEISDPITTKATSPPGKPIASDTDVTCDSIALKWENPQYGSENIQSYNIMCCLAENNEEVKVGTVKSAETATVITGLSPRTGYRFKVQPNSGNTVGSSSEYSDVIETKATSPPGKPTASVVHYNSIELKWSRPEIGEENVKSYKILYCNLTQTDHKPMWKELVVFKLQESVTVPGLESNMGYRFKVQPECDGVAGTVSKISDIIYTKAASPPGQPTAVNVTHNNIEIQWTKPQVGSEYIRNYKVHFLCYSNYVTNAEKKWISQATSDKSLSITLKGLQHNTSYVVKVEPQCVQGVKGQGNESKVSVPIKTKATSPPGKPKVGKSSHNSVTLMWDGPEIGIENIDYYMLLYKATHIPEWSEVKVTKSSYEVIGLVPNTKYCFKVRPVCKSGDDGTISEISDDFQTKPVCRPGKPQATTVTHDRIQISWTKPDYFHQNVNHYLVHYKSVSGRPESGEWEQFKEKIAPKPEDIQYCGIKDLKHNNAYIFKVLPVSDAFCEVMESQQSDAITTKATTAPSKPKVVKVGYNYIELFWTKPRIGFEHIQYYNVHYYTQSEANSLKTVNTAGPKTTTVVGGLATSTKYIFSVEPVTDTNSGCKSETSDPIETDSNCTAGKPLGSLVSHDTITLLWVEPEHHIDTVKHYSVSYCPQSALSNKWIDVPFEITNCGATVSGLNPNTTYLFKVRPVCRGKTAIGIEDSFSDPIATKMTSPPGKPYHSAVQYNSIEIEWTKPNIGSEKVKYYTILYKSSETKKMEKKTVGPQEKMVIGGLDFNTGYRFKVRPECGDGGVGTESEISDTIKTKATSPPGQPVATTITHDSIEVKWTRPQYGHENVKGYTVFYHDETQPNKRYFFKDVKNPYKLTKLLPNTAYIVNVRPECKNGVGSDGEFSERITTCATDQPGKPDAYEVTHDSVALKWKRPTLIKGTLKGYTILYRLSTKSSAEWLSISCNVQTSMIIGGLALNTAYVFKVRPDLETNVGTESIHTSPVTTKATSPPSKPTATDGDITHESVSLRWTKPELGGSNIKGYTVLYCLLSDPNQDWKSQTSSTAQEGMIIHGLKTKSNYKFKVRSECKAGLGSESEESTPIETKAACKPGSIKVSNVTHNSVHLKWDQPEYFSDTVESYNVSYRALKSVTLPWDSQQTNGPENYILLTNLKPNTSYTFKVIPQCRDGIKTVQTTGCNIKTSDRPLAERMRDKWSKSSGPIEVGPPAIHKVKVKYDMESDIISKCHVGEHKPTSVVKERILMLVGATGAGKSTLINSIVNYIYGVQWENDFRFKLITGESTKNQTHSQTPKITAYTFYPVPGSPLNYTLTIIDTPGFGDTRGIQRDKEITRHIKEFFSVKPPNGIDQIHAIGFVAQAALARLTPTQKYVFDSILAMFGKDIANNIFPICTFADAEKPQVLVAIEEAGIKYSKELKFNNSALYAKQGATKINKIFWEMNHEKLTFLFTELETIEPQSLQLTKEVLETREQLETHIQGLQKQLTAGLGLIQQLQHEQQLIKQHGEDLSNMQNMTYEVEVSKRVEVELPKGQYVTNCLVCNFTCHFPCTISDNKKKYNCAAMEGSWISRNKQSKCEVCPGKCSWEQHVNNPFRYELVREMETRTFEDLIKRYVHEGEPDQELNTAEQVKSGIATQLHDVTTHVYDLIKKTHGCVQQLEVIALRPYPLDEVSYIDLMIESEQREGKKGFQQRIVTLEELKRQAMLLSGARNLKREEIESKESVSWWKLLFQ